MRSVKNVNDEGFAALSVHIRPRDLLDDRHAFLRTRVSATASMYLTRTFVRISYQSSLRAITIASSGVEEIERKESLGVRSTIDVDSCSKRRDETKPLYMRALAAEAEPTFDDLLDLDPLESKRRQETLRPQLFQISYPAYRSTREAQAIDLTKEEGYIVWTEVYDRWSVQ